jgi:hypothetical protein
MSQFCAYPVHTRITIRCETLARVRRLRSVRRLLSLTLIFLTVLTALAKDDEANIKAVLEDRYMEWIAAANKKEAETLCMFVSRLGPLIGLALGPRKQALNRTVPA